MVELLAEVTLIDFSYLNRLVLSTFTEVGPQFSNQDTRLELVIEKVTCKKLSTLKYPRSISVTSALLISKVQLCPTSSVGRHSYDKWTRPCIKHWMVGRHENKAIPASLFPFPPSLCLPPSLPFLSSLPSSSHSSLFNSLFPSSFSC